MSDSNHHISMPNGGSNNNPVWVDSSYWTVLPANTSFQQEFLFVDEVVPQEEKTSFLGSSKSISDMQTCLSLIHNTFMSTWPSLNIYFYLQVGKSKNCFQMLYGIPYLVISREKHKNYDLHMYCAYKRRKNDSFHALDGVVDGIDLGSKNEILNSQFNIYLLDVYKIRVWNWGFQITTENSVNVVAAKSYILSNTKVEKNRDWTFPMSVDAKNCKKFTETIAEWSRYNNGDNDER